MIAACGQMEAVTIDEAKAVWPVVDRLAAQAAQANVDLLVLPETTYPAYWLESVERYNRPDVERTPIVLDRFSRVAAKGGFWLVAGFVEEANGRLYNGAAVFDRSGRLAATARKNFLWDCDNRWFAPGEALTVVDSEFGRLGVLICADARAPEIAASLVAMGAEFLVEPTAWVNGSGVRRTYRNIQPDFLIRCRAMEFGVPYLCASKAGREDDKLEYVGQSLIVDAAGRQRAKAAIGGDQLITAEVAAGSPRSPSIEERAVARLMSDDPPFRSASPGPKVQLTLPCDAETAASSIENAGGRVARMAANDLTTFAAARCATLDGAQVIVARGRIHDEAFVRARAAENRIFVITAADRAQYVVAPDGAIIWRQADRVAALELDLALADDKRFTPETDLWEQRRAASYRLTPEAVAHGGSHCRTATIERTPFAEGQS